MSHSEFYVIYVDLGAADPPSSFSLIPTLITGALYSEM